MTVLINASPTNGLQMTSDGSGIVKLQSNSVTTNALAWVNWNGSTAVIRASYNVSSITRSSAGVYAVNFSTATTDANYAVCGSAGNANATTYLFVASQQSAPTTSSFSIVTTNSVYAGTDVAYISVAVFGN